VDDTLLRFTGAFGTVLETVDGALPGAWSMASATGKQKAPDPKGLTLTPVRPETVLLLVATLVASLTKQLAVLLLRHALASLLDYRTHTDLTKFWLSRGSATDTKTPF